VVLWLLVAVSFFKGVLGTRFGSLELKIESLKIIIGCLESEKIESLE